MESNEVESFYDDFSSFQQSISYNERHFLMQDKMLRLGLNKNSNVLELGCGIGVISSLMAKVVKNGKIIAVDISPKSIEIANQRNLNVEFHVGDVTEFESKEIEYDFISLFDVLEHIPVELQTKLFQNIEAHMASQTKLLVNIPNPEFLVHLRKTTPESLQVIDQPLPLDIILNSAKESGLTLTFFERYDLWHKGESQFMIFERRIPFNPIHTVAPKPSLLRRIQNKFGLFN